MMEKSKCAGLVSRSGSFSPNDCVVSRRVERRLDAVGCTLGCRGGALDAALDTAMSVVLDDASCSSLAPCADAACFLANIVVPRNAARMLSASLSVNARRFSIDCSVSLDSASWSTDFASSAPRPVKAADRESTSLSLLFAEGDKSVADSVESDDASASDACISANDCDTLSEPVSACVGYMYPSEDAIDETDDVELVDDAECDR